MVPIVMKKGRMATLLSILVGHKDLDAILKILFSETSTLGVRMHPVMRRKLPRSQRVLQTSLGAVTAKSVTLDGHERLVPEFEECKRLALEKGLPLMEVYRILENEFRR